MSTMDGNGKVNGKFVDVKDECKGTTKDMSGTWGCRVMDGDGEVRDAGVVDGNGKCCENCKQPMK